MIPHMQSSDYFVSEKWGIKVPICGNRVTASLLFDGRDEVAPRNLIRRYRAWPRPSRGLEPKTVEALGINCRSDR